MTESLAMLTKGWIIGISIAAPVGPIGLLCIQRSITKGILSGVSSGLGAALADLFYGTIAVLGISGLNELMSWEKLLRGVGGLFIIWLGYRTMTRSVSNELSKTDNEKFLVGDLCSTLGLTLTNPMTILSFGAVFGALGITTSGTPGRIAVITGVFAGSMSWWIFLSFLSSRMGSRLSSSSMTLIDKIFGGVLSILGLVLLCSLINFH